MHTNAWKRGRIELSHVVYLQRLRHLISRADDIKALRSRLARDSLQRLKEGGAGSGMFAQFADTGRLISVSRLHRMLTEAGHAGGSSEEGASLGDAINVASASSALSQHASAVSAALAFLSAPEPDTPLVSEAAELAVPTLPSNAPADAADALAAGEGALAAGLRHRAARTAAGVADASSERAASSAISAGRVGDAGWAHNAQGGAAAAT
ncbi:hypothetical protein EON66_09255, partial [archaeon]